MRFFLHVLFVYGTKCGSQAEGIGKRADGLRIDVLCFYDCASLEVMIHNLVYNFNPKIVFFYVAMNRYFEFISNIQLKITHME